MAAFDFAVVSGGEGSDTLVTDAEIREGFLEQRRADSAGACRR